MMRSQGKMIKRIGVKRQGYLFCDLHCSLGQKNISLLEFPSSGFTLLIHYAEATVISLKQITSYHLSA